MSLKGDKYETAEEVRFRLEGSVVLYDGEPVYITRVTMPEDLEEKDEVARVFFRALPFSGMGQKDTRKFLSSRKFDLTPFPMGYMNYKGGVVYISRAPIRQNRQGLSSGNCTLVDITGSKHKGINFSMAIAATEFVDMVKGKYPNFKDVGDLLNNKETSQVAISRSFAFEIDNDLDALVLFHKNVKCGLALKGDKHFRVPAKYHFLRQEMEENRIPIS